MFVQKPFLITPIALSGFATIIVKLTRADTKFMNVPIPTLAEIKQMIFQLPIQEQVTLMEDLEEKLDTLQIMQLAETGFTEWNDEEEDIYDV
jgi:hypothetical protein